MTAPQLSELLSNPASPGTDANDEFVELYNPNAVAFDLSGFTLEAGLTTMHRYMFPAGTSLAPHGFSAFFSADTGLGMSNSGGQVRLFDPLGNKIAESDPYGTAKDGQAWILAQGSWRWTTTPTPNAVNVVQSSATTTAKKTATTGLASAATKKSTSVVKGATTSAKAAKSSAATPASAAATTGSGSAPGGARSLLQPGVLALIGAFALLYGAYEYRHDLANKFRELRRNRATRRKAGGSTEGW